MFVSRVEQAARLDPARRARPRRAFDMMTTTNGTDVDQPGMDRWDWSSTVVVALGVVMVLLLTFELWVSH